MAHLTGGPSGVTPLQGTRPPTGDGTNVTVHFSGLSADDAAFYPQLWRVTLTDRNCLWRRRTRAWQLSQEPHALRSILKSTRDESRRVLGPLRFDPPTSATRAN